MSFLKGALSGLARGGSDILDSRKKEEDEQRVKVDTNIYNTTGKLFETAAEVRKTRQAEIKKHKEFSNLLTSKDDSLSPAQMAYALSLPESAREDLLKLVDSPTFQNAYKAEGKTLTEYFEAIDDPIEFKDPITLTERVRGRVESRPLDSSQYYGVSTTEDAEVDKIVAGYAGGFATAYGMSAERAQGLLDYTTQEVKMQRFKINWANKKYQSSQADAFNIAKLAAYTMDTEKDNQGIAKLLKEQNDIGMNSSFETWASGEGVPSTMFSKDATLAGRWKKSKAYGMARQEIIKQMAKDMIEAKDRVLDRSTKLFFSREYPGYWGGNANELPKGDIKKAAYYEITSKGEVEIMRGVDILRMLEKNTDTPTTATEETATVLTNEQVVDTGLKVAADEANSESTLEEQSRLQDTQVEIANPEIDELKKQLDAAKTPRAKQIIREKIIQAQEKQDGKDLISLQSKEYDRYAPNLDTATLSGLAEKSIITGRTTPSPRSIYRKIKNMYPNISEVVGMRFAKEAAEAYNNAN